MFRAVPSLLCAVVAVASVGMVAQGGESFLEAADGRLFGPLPDAEGREIEIDGHSYRLRKNFRDGTLDDELERKLRRLRIPRLEFVEASLWDTLAFLGSTAAELDPEGPGIRIDFDKRFRTGSDGPPPSWYEDVLPAIAEIRVTLALADASLYDALRYTTEVAGITFRLEDGRVVVCPVEGFRPVSPGRKWLDPGRTCSVEDSDEARGLVERTRSIRVPETKFTDAHIADVLWFLRGAAQDVGNDVNIVLVTRAPVEISDESDPAAVELCTSPTLTPGLLTMDLRDISMFDAVHFVSAATGLSARFENHAIVVGPALGFPPDRPPGKRAEEDLRDALRLIADEAALAEIAEYNRALDSAGTDMPGPGYGEAATPRPLYLTDYRVESGRPSASPGEIRGGSMEFTYTLRDRIDAPPRMRWFTVEIRAGFSGPGRAGPHD